MEVGFYEHNSCSSHPTPSDVPQELTQQEPPTRFGGASDGTFIFLSDCAHEHKTVPSDAPPLKRYQFFNTVLAEHLTGLREIDGVSVIGTKLR